MKRKKHETKRNERYLGLRYCRGRYKTISPNLDSGQIGEKIGRGDGFMERNDRNGLEADRGIRQTVSEAEERAADRLRSRVGYVASRARGPTPASCRPHVPTISHNTTSQQMI